MVTYRDDEHLKTAMMIGKSKKMITMQFVTDSETDDRRMETTE